MGYPWTTLGSDWHSLATLWLRAEAILTRAARSDLTFNEIRLSDIPDAWKEWMYAKILRLDSPKPTETFGQVLTDYLAALPSSTRKSGGTVMDQIWCRPGKTGIFGLLVCLYWQAEYSGAGNDWIKNLKCVRNIFNAILSDPGL